MSSWSFHSSSSVANINVLAVESSSATARSTVTPIRTELFDEKKEKVIPARKKNQAAISMIIL